MSAAALWRVAVAVDDLAEAETVAAALGEASPVIGVFEEPGGGWLVEGLSRDKPDRALIEAMLALAWSGQGAPPTVTAEQVPSRDWLAENQASFRPIRAGRFFVHGSHYDGRVPRDSVPIVIDAATAFGTGEHATTRGCLLALDRVARHGLARQGSRLSILDMGCGTGILALAAARLWHRPVLACDIDPEAVRVTRVNARRNQVAPLLRAAVASRYDDRVIRHAAPFDLVFANILARPLIALAPGLARALAPGGIAILSGLLARQENAVMAAHRALGLRLRARIALEGWRMLIIEKPIGTARGDQ